MFKKTLFGFILFSFMSIASAASLTGTWKFEGYAGNCYVRQVGNEVWWSCEETPTSPTWSSVAHGKIDSNRVILSWADVPKGTNTLSGILVLKVVSDKRLEVLTKTGGFGANALIR
jgi:hypothetical protein